MPTSKIECPEENSSGIINCRNGHIEYHIGQKYYGLKDNAIMMFGREVKDNYYFLQLDAFDVSILIETLFKSLTSTQKENMIINLQRKEIISQ